ncbi:MAG: TRAP transporter small permease [Spirochaetes bacterium]|nr:TRAP transporter small permease [Spirochaetota bacterium]
MLKKIEEYFIIFIFAVIILLVFTQVISRYILKESLSSSEEIVRYLFVWLTFIGIAFAFHNSSHIKITVLSDKVKFFNSRLYQFIYLIIGLIFFITLFIFSIKVTMLQHKTGQKIVSGVPTWFLGLSVVCGSILIILYYIKNFLKNYPDK